MRVAVVGGGPAGLYFSLCLAARRADAEILVFERGRADDAHGFGVVFSRRTLETLAVNDAPSAARLEREFVRWDAIETHIHGGIAISRGHEFVGIERPKLLEALAERCRELGVRISHDCRVTPGSGTLSSFDLVVAADGVGSCFRSSYATELGSTERHGRNKYVWLGARGRIPDFKFFFEETDAGWIWAHAYPYTDDHSTFIVECGAHVWSELGLGTMDTRTCCRALEQLFATGLEGRGLVARSGPDEPAPWQSFLSVQCRRWSVGDVVLIGDALHTLHFSIGSGTRQAFDDAFALAAALECAPDPAAAVRSYRAVRDPVVESLRVKAELSMSWFENVERFVHLPTPEFEASLMARATPESSAS